MYKAFLCWRYLRTRYIALVSIVSVTLGVATMIVVNSVMAGFTTEMQERLHGILSDLTFEAYSFDGFDDPDWHMKEIERVAGDDIEGMAPAVAVPAVFSFKINGKTQVRPVQVFGIDHRAQNLVGDFGKYLQHPENRKQLSFDLREGGYDAKDPQGNGEGAKRIGMEYAGWEYRRQKVEEERLYRMKFGEPAVPPEPENLLVEDEGAAKRVDPFGPGEVKEFDETKHQHTGVVLGMGLVSYRNKSGNDQFLLLPGDNCQLTLPTTSVPPKLSYDNFTVVDLYESKMSEYDQSFVFVPLEHLQKLRNMIDPTTGIGAATSIQIKLKPGRDLDAVRDKLRAAFAPELYNISTWRDKQGPLLAAVHMETAILNVLLFLIIAVAGFGILAIFFMIVVEKTRDIGILKSLGASGRGVMGIFLAYGLSLGIVGAGVGAIIGLLFVFYINEIAGALAWVTGQPIFDPSIYYFYRIPTIVEPFTVTWIVSGAIAIAVLASVLPARRAARFHPVEALRYE